MTMPTTAPLSSGSGSLSGIAAQAQPSQHVNLPPDAAGGHQAPPAPAFPGPAIVWSRMRSNSFGSTER